MSSSMGMPATVPVPSGCSAVIFFYSELVRKCDCTADVQAHAGLHWLSDGAERL